jgi:hypothetical protein
MATNYEEISSDSETDRCSSTSSDDVADRDQDPISPPVVVLQPYQHEPLRKGSPPPLSPLEQQRTDRIGRIDW